MTISARQLEYLDAMGIQVWQERVSQAEQVPDELSEDIEADNLVDLQALAATCQRCDASKTRQHMIFADGSVQADWFIVGDFASEEDGAQGRPFTGHVAHLLSEMLLAIGVRKSTSYLTNSVKCYSTSNYSEQSALLSCRSYLLRQIQLVKPAVIIVLGEKAAHSLLKSDSALTTLIGSVQKVDDIALPIVVTHHPRYLLESPMAKRQAWDDLQLARQIVNKRHVE